jgi:hypothetical protein
MSGPHPDFLVFRLELKKRMLNLMEVPQGKFFLWSDRTNPLQMVAIRY